MTTFDFAKLVDVGAVKAGLQSRPDEMTREAAAMTYEELLAEFRRQERAAYEAGRVHGKRRQTVNRRRIIRRLSPGMRLPGFWNSPSRQRRREPMRITPGYLAEQRYLATLKIVACGCITSGRIEDLYNPPMGSPWDYIFPPKRPDLWRSRGARAIARRGPSMRRSRPAIAAP
jgi:hypothetical protein